MLTANGGLEGLLHRARDWPQLACTDDAMVNLAYSDALGCRAGHKDLVGDV